MQLLPQCALRTPARARVGLSVHSPPPVQCIALRSRAGARAGGGGGGRSGLLLRLNCIHDSLHLLVRHHRRRAAKLQQHHLHVLGARLDNLRPGTRRQIDTVAQRRRSSDACAAAPRTSISVRTASVTHSSEAMPSL